MKEVYTGKVNVNPTQAFNISFKSMIQDNTMYFNPQMGIDLRPQLNDIASVGLKALSPTTGGAGTAGYAMVPIYLDPRIVDTTRKYTPLVEMIPRVTNLGLTADFNKITAKGQAFTAAADAPLNENDDTYDRVSKTIKYIYSVGRVLGPAQAAYPAYQIEGFQPTGSGLIGTNFGPQAAPNAKQLEVIMKARSMREEEERLIINGDSSSTPTEFDGIVVEQSTTNVVDKSGADVTYDDTETAIRYAFDDGGRPNLGVASSSVLADLRRIAIDTFHYRPADMTTELPFGVSSHLTLETMVGPIPIIPSMQLTNTTDQKQIFFLDMNYIEMRVLQDLTYEDLAKTNDSQKFYLKIYECLVMKNPAFNSFIDNID